MTPEEWLDYHENATNALLSKGQRFSAAEWSDRAAYELDAATDATTALRAVLDLHAGHEWEPQPGLSDLGCRACWNPHPCDTRKTITAALVMEEDA